MLGEKEVDGGLPAMADDLKMFRAPAIELLFIEDASSRFPFPKRVRVDEL
jgi:hypothetical protein